MLDVRAISAFSDNYIWLLTDGGRQACVVDPGDAAPVIAALEAADLELATILVTHHHPDHVGGVAALRERWPETIVYGPRGSPARCITQALGDADRITVFGHAARVIAVPGHTLDHIAYLFEALTEPLLFCGDTLFAGGCGRVFEGDAVMMHASLSRLAALPPETRIYCAHEYTLSNLRFAQAVEPDNRDLAKRQERDVARRALDQPTVPGTLAEELATNPFLRCATIPVRKAAIAHAGRELAADHEVFAVVRGWKDGFR